MNILNLGASWIFIPVEKTEEQTVAAIIAIGPGKLKYNGRAPDTEGDLKLKFSMGDIKFVLCGSTELDRHWVCEIRNTCYFGSGGLIFVAETKTKDGKTALIMIAKRCKHCGADMIDMAACEWSTCVACVLKCEHRYASGHIHGPGMDAAIGEYCEKCGRIRSALETPAK